MLMGRCKVCTSIYRHKLNRLRIMLRGALIGLLHTKALNYHGRAYADARVITLMSVDVSSVEVSAQTFHETWANLLEFIVGISLLAREVGWLWLLPLTIIFCKLSPC